MHVLMAEDATTVRMFYRSILQTAGFSVEEAVNGQEALERAIVGEPTPDLFLVDVNMPLMDGYTLLRRIRGTPELCDIPAIIISTIRDQNEEAQAFEAGANLVLVKPVHPDLLTRYARALSGASEEQGT
jgi:two-component system chemotaxis response regulator CheY